MSLGMRRSAGVILAVTAMGVASSGGRAQNPPIIRDHRVSSAGAAAVIPDVKRAFDRVEEKHSRQINFTNRAHFSEMPRGFNESMRYHQQGVQKLASGGFVVSGSTPTGSASYFYVTDAARNVINVTIVERGNFSHAGGIQVCGNILGVGVENPSKSSEGSRVHFYDLSNPAQPRKLALVISRPTETAGAVGLALAGNEYVCVVGNYDSKRLDFYRFSPARLNSTSGVMSTVGRNVDASGWQAYQNLNLFVDGAQNLWIVGMHTDKVPFMEDWADLWKVTFPPRTYQVSKEGKKHHISSTDGSRFLYGSGYCYNAARAAFEVFSVEARMNSSGVARGAAWNL